MGTRSVAADLPADLLALPERDELAAAFDGKALDLWALCRPADGDGREVLGRQAVEAAAVGADIADELVERTKRVEQGGAEGEEVRGRVDAGGAADVGRRRRLGQRRVRGRVGAEEEARVTCRRREQG